MKLSSQKTEILAATVIFTIYTIRGLNMRLSYNPLWKLLIDRNMNKTELRKLTGLSSASISKLNKGENVTTDILLRICEALDCELNDIVEIIRT